MIPSLDPEELPPDVRAALAALGRYGAASREVVEATCAACGRPIVGLRTKKYCDAACRQRAHRIGPLRAG